MNGSRPNTTGRKQIPKYSSCATCAQKPTARYPNHRSRRRRQKFGQGKKVAVQRVPRTSDNGNISATSFGSITVTTCKLFRQNPHDFCSSFLSRRVPQHDETIAWKPGFLRPNETEPAGQSATRSSVVVCFCFCGRSRSAGSGGSQIQTLAIHCLRTGRGDCRYHESRWARY